MQTVEILKIVIFVLIILVGLLVIVLMKLDAKMSFYKMMFEINEIVVRGQQDLIEKLVNEK